MLVKVCETVKDFDLKNTQARRCEVKKNWIKGLDRTAILIAIPIAIFCGIYKSNAHTNSKTLWVFQPERVSWEYMLAPSIQKANIERIRTLGFEDRELVNYFNLVNDYRVPQLEIGLRKGFRLHDLQVIKPCLTERFIIGALWGIGAAIISVLGVAVTTRGIPRTIRWLKNGFSTGETTINKKKRS